ncbi:MAG: MBL fold metallo-hydrolase [Thermodesulfobacteriota bacterium]
MKVCTLASGSSGNSVYLETAYSKILIDAGISLRQIKLRLENIGVNIKELDAVIISHEHTDHSLAVSKINVPVYVSTSTTFMWKDKVQHLREFDSETVFELNDLEITPFSVPHDAIDPVGFTFNDGTKKLGIATDIGSVTSLVVEKLKDSNILILESNHDTEILLYSNYPWQLKQRIKGRLGHLSNKQSAWLLKKIFHNNLEHIVLAHLSKVNNCPEIAYKTSYNVLESYDAQHVTLSVAPRNSVSEVISV